MALDARLKAFDDPKDNAAWGKTVASRGGFRQERDDRLREANDIRAERPSHRRAT
ncbi:MAG: hypothetical protein M3O00_17720 [Pseudomonadota bacterium]|nr:hypothetical protein [Pseudomonadota bacterium]